MELHPAIGSNRYCGPAAFAILTGKDTDFAAKELRAHSGKKMIRGISATILTKALQGHGLETKQVSKTEWATLSMRNRRPRVEHWAAKQRPGVYLVASSSHFMVIDTRTSEACDNITIYPLPLAKYRYRRMKVQYAFRITPATGVVNLARLRSAQGSIRSMEELRTLLTLP